MKSLFAIIFFVLINIGVNGLKEEATTTSAIPTTTTTEHCPASVGNVEIIAGTHVNLKRDIYRSLISLGICGWGNPLGLRTYYNGTNPLIPDTSVSRAIGTWWRDYCDKPCICSAHECYEPRDDGDLTLYPYCSSETGCFVAVLMNRRGRLVNPKNSSDVFSSFNQINLDTFVRKPVTDSSYLKAVYLGCEGCQKFLSHPPEK